MAEATMGAPVAPAAQGASNARPTEQSNQPAQGSAPQVPDFSATKHRLKVNDVEEELSYEELKARAQKASAADRRFEQAAAKERRLGKLIEQAKKGDLTWLENLIGEEAAVQWAENRLGRVIDWNKKTPEEQRAIKAERERDEKARLLAEREAEDARRQRHIEVIREAKALDAEMNEAFKKLGQPVNPYLIKWAAEQMEAAMPDEDDEDQEYEPMSAEAALSAATRRVGRDVVNILPRLPKEQRLQLAPMLVKAMMEGIDIGELRAVLPRDFLDALRKANLKDAEDQDPLRAGRANPDASATRRDPTSIEMGKPRSKSRIVASTTDEYFKLMEESLNKKRRRG